MGLGIWALRHRQRPKTIGFRPRSARSSTRAQQWRGQIMWCDPVIDACENPAMDTCAFYRPRCSGMDPPQRPASPPIVRVRGGAQGDLYRMSAARSWIRRSWAPKLDHASARAATQPGSRARRSRSRAALKMAPPAQHIAAHTARMRHLRILAHRDLFPRRLRMSRSLDRGLMSVKPQWPSCAMTSEMLSPA